MRIYSEVVLDMQTCAVIFARAGQWRGPVALCKNGGGSTTTNTYDPKYNAGILAIQQEQQDWARKFANLFEYGVTYDPNETTRGLFVDGKWVDEKDLTAEQGAGEQWIKNPEYKEGRWETKQVQVGRSEGMPIYEEQQVWVPGTDVPEKIINPNYKLEEKTWGEIYGYDPNAQVSEMQLMQRGIEAAAELLPLQTALARSQLEADQQLVPAQTQLSLAQIASEMGLVPKRGELEATQIADTLAGIGQRAPVREEFYKQALAGVDVNRRMQQAGADVEHAFAAGDKDFERGIFTSGLKLNPNDGAYIAALNQRNLAKTAGIAGARSGARTLAEQEMFARLKSAMGTE